MWSLLQFDVVKNRCFAFLPGNLMHFITQLNSKCVYLGKTNNNSFTTNGKM